MSVTAAHILRAALPATLCAGLSLVAAGCTRTYDGTVVPAYQLVPAEGRPFGGFDMKPTDPLPPNRLYKFPPAPPPPPSAEPAYERPPPKRRPGKLIPRIDGHLPRKVSCHNQTVEGRVRVVCL